VSALNADRLRELLTTQALGRAEMTLLAETGSTNADALAMAAKDAPHGTVVAAEFQTAGRGRHSRRWESTPGADLLVSVLLRPQTPLEFQPSMVLAAGLAARATLEPSLPEAPQLKWPNDLLVAGRKICGILCAQGSGAVVVGLGLNVNSTTEQRPPELAGLATSLQEITGQAHDRTALLAQWLGHLERFFFAWEADRAAVMAQWEDAADLRGRRVNIDADTGAFGGIAAGIDAHGRLLVDVAGERRLVTSGDLTLEG
jgi:BirA family transcriptional regulator, biotin operon repressor / biotin---[acetyl-CoA-carboxylase] ligase